MTNPFTPEHDLFRKTVRDFAEKELLPHQKEWEAARDYPARKIFKRAGELGILGVTFSPEVGGSGGDYWFKAVFCEEIVRCRMAGLAMDLMVQADIATPVIEAVGTAEQKKEFLVPALAGEIIGALGITEPGGGSDVANLKTTARRDGGDFIVNGAKTFITNGSRADFITLAVRTGGPGAKGVSLLLFPTKTKGFAVGRKLEKLGNHSSDTAELAFTNCRVPARYLLGEENKGFYLIMKNFQGERLVAALSSVAGAQLAVDDAVTYLKQREAFGQPVMNFQVWRHKFAERLAELEAARRLTYHAVDLYNRKQESLREVSMAKLIAGDLANRIAYDCLQAFGGYGYMEEYDIARYFRDIRLITIGAGTSEIMKEIIAKQCGF